MIASALVTTARLFCGGARWVGVQPDAGQRIYFANHTSHLDFLALWSALPAEVRALTRPVAARDYWQAGRLRRFLAARVFNAVLIDRRPRNGRGDALDVMLAALAEGCSLILFPEGTRGSGEDMGPFRGGLYTLGLRRPDVELTPAYISNLHRVLPKGEFLPLPLLSSVTFGAAIRIRQGESRDEFLERARAAVLELRQR